MATITITIPDASLPRITAAFDAEYPGRTDAGQTLNQWAKTQVVEFVKQVTRNYEGRVAAAADMQAKATEINAINIT